MLVARCWSGLCLGSSSYWFGARSFTHPKVGFFLTPLSFSKFYIFGLSNFGLSNLYLTSFKFYIWSFKLVFQIWFFKFIFGFSSFFLGISGRYCYEGVCHRHRSNAFSWAVFWIALSWGAAHRSSGLGCFVFVQGSLVGSGPREDLKLKVFLHGFRKLIFYFCDGFLDGYICHGI